MAATSEQHKYGWYGIELSKHSQLLEPNEHFFTENVDKATFHGCMDASCVWIGDTFCFALSVAFNTEHTIQILAHIFVTILRERREK